MNETRHRSFMALLFLLPLHAAAQEICDNGIDDDGDGLIDLNDPDCPCSVLINPQGAPSFIVNHSFEERDCCPFSFATPFQNWLDCAAYWNQATVATSDYFHECGFSPSTFPLPPPDGEGAIGFISTTDYKEYVGTCLTFPGPPAPLQAGVTYTLSLWTAGLSISNTNFMGEPNSIGVYYEGEYPLALFGNADCVPFPIPTVGCVGSLPGWEEIARVRHQPDGEWERVSMTFTPDREVHSVILGPACDLPETYTVINRTIQHEGMEVPMIYYPYTLVDDLMLTEAVDQVLTPVTNTGHVCQGSVVVTAAPPVGATDHQWYLDGVAIVGQTGLTLDASALGLGGGRYTLASTFEGQCLMGSTNVAPPIVPSPMFELSPVLGCAPLTVSFRDTTGGVLTSTYWGFGDGSEGEGAEVEHTYMSPGIYDVRIRVRTELGCERDSILPGAVEVIGDPVARITASPNPVSVEAPEVTLSASGSSGDVVRWWWDLGDVPPGMHEGETLNVTFPSEAGGYPVVLVVENEYGCSDTTRTMVVVLGVLEMPNVFSPNGDGSNDVFRPLRESGVGGVLEIYNRWGQKVFSTEVLDLGWDGRVEGGDAPAGTYYYIVTPDGDDGNVLSGHVTLIR